MLRVQGVFVVCVCVRGVCACVCEEESKPILSPTEVKIRRFFLIIVLYLICQTGGLAG